MLDGIKIITTTPIYTTEYLPGWSWAGFMMTLVTIFAIYLLTVTITHHEGLFPTFLGIFCVALCLFTTILMFSHGKETEVYSHDQYGVIIESGVDCKEFFEQYNVVDRIDNMIIIEEREVDEK